MREDPLASASDADVVARVLNGEVNAYAVLLDRHAKHVGSIVSRHVPQAHVEETSHEVFIRAFKGLAGLNNSGDFGHWVSSIAVKTCCDFWRKQYKSKEVPLSSLSDKHQEWLETVLADESGSRFEQACRQEEAVQVLDWAMARLSPKDRMAVELIHLEGMAIKDAAQLLGWSVANVKVRTFRARKKLEKLLQAPCRP